MNTLFLIRHATPDWSRKDIRYDIPPGPPLTLNGQREAQVLGTFLKTKGVRKLFYSPLERTAHTAKIAAAIAKIKAEEHLGLAEWRHEESEADIQKKIHPLLESFLNYDAKDSPIGLVTHGGPIGSMLKYLGMDAETLAIHRKSFDHGNPVPPAGVWAVRPFAEGSSWRLQLVFKPREDK